MLSGVVDSHAAFLLRDTLGPFLPVSTKNHFRVTLPIPPSTGSPGPPRASLVQPSLKLRGLIGRGRPSGGCGHLALFGVGAGSTVLLSRPCPMITWVGLAEMRLFPGRFVGLWAGTEAPSPTQHDAQQPERLCKCGAEPHGRCSVVQLRRRPLGGGALGGSPP